MSREEKFIAMRISRGPSAMNGRASSGFNNVVLSFKWQLPVSYGFYSGRGWWPRISLHPLRKCCRCAFD